MQILATYNIKGGVGKTASAVNLAFLAARDGARTLVWDLDPQGAASYYFRIKPRVKGGGKGLVSGKRQLDEAVKGTDFENLDLVPADFSYRNLDLALADAKRPVKQLLRMLRPLADEYDLLFLDCPPSISLVSENVFYAADALLIPMIPTTLSLRTYAQLLSYLKKHRLTGVGLLPFFSMVDRRKRLHKETVESLQSRDKRVLRTIVPYASLIEMMGLHRAPVGSYAAASLAGQAYEALWREVRSRVAKR